MFKDVFISGQKIGSRFGHSADIDIHCCTFCISSVRTIGIADIFVWSCSVLASDAYRRSEHRHTVVELRVVFHQVSHLYSSAWMVGPRNAFLACYSISRLRQFHVWNPWVIWSPSNFIPSCLLWRRYKFQAFTFTTSARFQKSLMYHRFVFTSIRYSEINISTRSTPPPPPYFHYKQEQCLGMEYPSCISPCHPIFECFQLAQLPHSLMWAERCCCPAILPQSTLSSYRPGSPLNLSLASKSPCWP